MSVFIVFASRRGDFEEMMDVRGVIGELAHQSSPFTDIKARSATSSTGVFIVFFYTHIENYPHETNNAIRTSTYYLYPCRGSSVRIDP